MSDEPIAHVIGRTPPPRIGKLKCSICGELFTYVTIRDKDPATICCREDCIAERVRQYWEAKGYRADVQLKNGYARLLSIQRIK